MSDTHAPDGASRRRRRNPRQGGGQNRNRSNSNSGNSSFRPKPPKQTAFQKLLSMVTFGWLGQPKPKQRSKSTREPTSNVTIVTSKRSERSERPERPERSDRPERSGAPRQRRESTPPDLSAVTSGRLYIGNLSYDASESDLFELFNGVGAVKNAEIVVNNRTQRSKGFAFVTMDSVEEARRAVGELHGKDFMGRPLQISGAKPAPGRDSDDQGTDDADEENEEEAERTSNV